MGVIGMKRCAMGLMSAIGPEMTGVGWYTFTFNAKYSFDSKKIFLSA